MGRILVYHSVAPAGDRIEQATQVSARRFREQLLWLRRASYEFETLAALRVSDVEVNRDAQDRQDEGLASRCKSSCLSCASLFTSPYEMRNRRRRVAITFVE